jgi:hypothetical protein
MSIDAVPDDLGPDHVAVALDHAVRAAELCRLFRKERRVNAAVHDPRASLAREASDFVATQRVPGVNPDADHVARRNRFRIDVRDRFVDDQRVAPRCTGGGREDVEPARRDDRDAERHVTGVDQMDTHGRVPSSETSGNVLEGCGSGAPAGEQSLRKNARTIAPGSAREPRNARQYAS